MNWRSAWSWVLANGMFILILAVIVGAALFIIGGMRSCHSNEQADLIKQLLNAQAANDTLRLRIASRDSAIRVYEQQAFITDEIHELELAEERESREALRRQTQVLASMYIRLRQQVEGQTTPTHRDEDTIIQLASSEGLVDIAGEVTLKNHLVPITVPVTYWLEAIVEELPLRVAVEVNKDTCAPFIRVTSQHPSVTVGRVEGHVSEELTCLDEMRKGFPWKATAFTLAAVSALLATQLGGN